MRPEGAWQPFEYTFAGVLRYVASEARKGVQLVILTATWARRPSGLLAEGQDVAAEPFRAAGQEVQRVLLKTGPGLPDLHNILAAMGISLVPELHEADVLQRTVRAVDGFEGQGL